MRDGIRPAGFHSPLPAFLPHRIIIPVYVPGVEGFYKDALEILKLCLESLYATVHDKASITVVSNGCAEEVIAELEQCYRSGWFDQLLLNRCNRGKIDAVTSVARGAVEDFITISDCDVLFLPGWLAAIEEIFRYFPECGFASPAPNPRCAWSHTSATILGGLLRSELAFKKVVPDSDLDRFANSIGWPDMFGFEDRQSQMVVRRGETTACVGAGHFVCTMRKEVIAAMPDKLVRTGVGGEEEFLDKPPDSLGFWRLSTSRAYAHHMGNVPEPWMHDEFERCQAVAPAIIGDPFPPPALDWTGRLPWRARRLAVRMFKSVSSRRSRLKGLVGGTASAT